MTYLTAALLGVIQGLTEFLPVSSTAHLLIAGRLLGFEDPGDVFKVMIQLGSILAVMWLYRQKILAVVTGLPSNAAARHFAVAIVVASIPALAAGALLAGYVKRVLYNNLDAIAAAFVVGGIVMLVVERFRPHPTVVDAEQDSGREGVRSGTLPDAGAAPWRVSFGRHDCRRHDDGD